MEVELNGGRPHLKTNSMEGFLNWRKSLWKTNLMEYDLNGRRPQWKKTTMEDYQKMTSMEDDTKDNLQEADDISLPS